MAGSAVIGALRVNLSIDTAAFANGLGKAQSSLQRFGTIAARGIAVAATAFSTAAGVLAIAMKGTINEADKLGKMAQSIGIPVEELSRLAHAADLSDVSLEGLATSLGRLSRNMSDVAAGAGAEAKRAFDQLGISVRNSDGSLRSSSGILAEVADRFAGMSDGSQKTAIALQLFGRSGLQMIPMLNAGAAGLKEMMQEADRLGIVIDQKTARAAEAFNDNLTRLGRVKDGIITKITAEMLPALANLSQALIDTAKNTDVMRQVSGFLVQSFHVAIDIAAQVAVGIRRIGIELRGLGEMSRLFMAGEFRAGWEAYKQSIAESQAAFAGLAAFQLKMLSSEAFDAPDIDVPDYTPTITDLTKVGAAARAAKAELDALNSRAESVFEATRTPIESYGIAVTELNTLFAEGAIGFDTYNRALAQNRDDLSGLGDAAKSVGQSLQSSLGGAFDSLLQGTFNLRESISGLFQDLARLAMNTLLQSLLGGIGGGAAGGGFRLPGFAHGGAFDVGGAGGIDSQLVAFRATPGERVTVDKDGQAPGGTVRLVIEEHPMFGARVRAEATGVVVQYDRRQQRRPLQAG